MNAPEPIPFVPLIEENLLGILLSGHGFQRVRPFLTASHFVDPINARIYDTVTLTFDRFGSSGIMLVEGALTEDLRKAIRDQHSQPPAAVLARMMGSTPHTAASVERAAQNVIDQWARIEMNDVVQGASAALHDVAADPGEVAKRVGTGLEAILSDVRSANRGRTRAMIGEVATEVVEYVESAVTNGSGVTGIPWGPLSEIDRVTGGMQRQDLILIGARPSMGKTSVATTIALGAARKGYGVGFLSLEMSRLPLVMRAASDLTLGSAFEIPYADMLNGRLDGAQLAHLKTRQAIFDRYPIEIDDGPASTFDVRAKIEGMMERFQAAGRPPLSVLIIDHLGFIQASAHYRGNRNNEIGEITRALKGFAKEYDLALVLLSQLSRDAARREDKRPQLADLRDSGNIEQDADFVGFLYREAYDLERKVVPHGDAEIEHAEKLEACRHQLEFIIAKARMGPTVTVRLWCDMALSAVRNGDRYRQ